MSKARATPDEHGTAVQRVLWHLMEGGPCSRDQLQQDAGVGDDSIGAILTRLRRQGRAHIAGWTREYRTVAVYAYGPGRDARKPAARAGHERARTYRRRQKARAFLGAPSVFHLGAAC